jgi:hypothetical protein
MHAEAHLLYACLSAFGHFQHSLSCCCMMQQLHSCISDFSTCALTIHHVLMQRAQCLMKRVAVDTALVGLSTPDMQQMLSQARREVSESTASNREPVTMHVPVSVLTRMPPATAERCRRCQNFTKMCLVLP